MDWLGGGLTRAQAQKQRKQLMAEIERDHRRKDREKLAALRKQIGDLKRRRHEAMRQAVARCKKNRIAVREHAKALRKQVLEALRESIRQEKEGARAACAMRKERIRGAATRQTDKTRELLRAERTLQAELRRVDQRSKKAERRTTARERQQESDDAVISNIDPELVPLFQRVRRQIRGSDRMTRTEHFLKFVEGKPRVRRRGNGGIEPTRAETTVGRGTTAGKDNAPSPPPEGHGRGACGDPILATRATGVRGSAANEGADAADSVEG